jgi:hypothetical protein
LPLIHALVKAQVLVPLLFGLRLLMNLSIESFLALLIILFFFVFFYSPGFFVGLAVYSSFAGVASISCSSCLSYCFLAILQSVHHAWAGSGLTSSVGLESLILLALLASMMAL